MERAAFLSKQPECGHLVSARIESVAGEDESDLMDGITSLGRALLLALCHLPSLDIDIMQARYMRRRK